MTKTSTFTEKLSLIQFLSLLTEKLDRIEQQLSIGSSTQTRPFLSSKSAAAYLGISLSTLDKYCSQRRIPFQKPNRMRRFLKEDLDHFLHSNRIRSDEEIDDAADRYMAKR